MPMFPTKDDDYARVYAREAAMVDAAEAIANALELSGMSRAALARALGVSPSEVTARLQGERNITVRKLAETLQALGQELHISLGSLASEASNPVRDAWTRRAAREGRRHLMPGQSSCRVPASLETYRNRSAQAS